MEGGGLFRRLMELGSINRKDEKGFFDKEFARFWFIWFFVLGFYFYSLFM